MTDTAALPGSATPLALLVALLLAGVAALAGYVWAQARHRQQALADQQVRAQRESAWQGERAELGARIARLEGQLHAEISAHEATRADLEWQRAQNGELDKRILPMKEAFAQLDKNVQQTERARVVAQTELQQKVSDMAKQFTEATADVKHEARKLSRVLSRSERRGAWGEMQLRTLVESAGMLPHVHFVEQDHSASASDGGALRPDMVIDLAGGRKVVVDSKVPLDAFLRMEDTDDPDVVLDQHAQAVAQHVKALSSKAYWTRYASPEFVIMFVPSEGLLSSALQAKPDLLQTALDRRVILASPTTLLSMLHAITYSWRQVEAAEQAQQIQEQGTELYKRLILMAERFGKLGNSLSTTVRTYDETIATLEARVLPAGRKLQKMTGDQKSLPDLSALDSAARTLDPARWPADPDDEPLADPQELRPAKRSPGTHSAA